jgi:hypothetical protein
MKKCVPVLIVSLCIMSGVVGCNSKKKADVTGYTLTAITIGTTYSESIPAFGSNLYVFTASTTGNHTVSVTGITAATSNIDWNLYDYISDNYSDYNFVITKAYSESSTTNGDEVKSLISLTAGKKYMLILDEWNTVATNYTLKVTQP